MLVIFQILWGNVTPSIGHQGGDDYTRSSGRDAGASGGREQRCRHTMREQHLERRQRYRRIRGGVFGEKTEV
jgi:hypothetical protein